MVSVPNSFIASVMYLFPDLTIAFSATSLKIDLACGLPAESNDLKKVLNKYLAFAASNNALPFLLTLSPAAPIITLNCSIASAEFVAKTSFSICLNIKSLGNEAIPETPFTPL